MKLIGLANSYYESHKRFSCIHFFGSGQLECQRGKAILEKWVRDEIDLNQDQVHLQAFALLLLSIVQYSRVTCCLTCL